MKSDRDRIDLRQYQRATPVPRDGLTIVLPANPDPSIETSLRQACTRHDINAVFETNPDAGIMRDANRPIVLAGNLADSKCVQHLYYRSICATDLWYPGPGGWELRTLVDPFGSGHNVIHLGYSDSPGLERALDKFISTIESGEIPYFCELHPARLHMPDSEADQFHNAPYPELGWQVVLSDLPEQKGFLAYLSGEPDVLNQYMDAWRIFLEEEAPTGGGDHLWLCSRAVVWRFLEVTGMLPDDLAQESMNYMYRWAAGGEGLDIVSKPGFQVPDYPKQNHALTPALGLIILGDYFKTYHPDTPGPDTWIEKAENCYADYGKSWKPLCDGLCHGWWLSQPTMLDHGLFHEDHRYFEQGGARLAAECAMAVVNNAGWMPSSGDSDLLRQFPGPSLRIAAAYYEDPAFRFVNDMAPEERCFRWLSGMPPTRRFETGMTPIAPPLNNPATVIPVDPLVYNTWRKQPEHSATTSPKASLTPPEAPIEKCFDKIAVRSGWDPDDDYLLIDGLGAGLHSYDDAGSVIDYARYGVSCIVAEDCLVWTRPEDHSGVTVVRNGLIGNVPSFAELEAVETDREMNAYLRMRLRNYAGCDWIREVFFRHNSCLVLRDTVEALEAGEYAVESHIRTPACAKPTPSGFISRRNSASAGEIEFEVTCLNTDAHLSLSEIPITVRESTLEDKTHTAKDAFDFQTRVASLWRERYQTEDKRLFAFKARIATPLAAGERIRITSLLQIRNSDERRITATESDTGVDLDNGRRPTHLKAFSFGTSKKNYTTSRRKSRSQKATAEFDAKISCIAGAPDGKLLVGTAGGEMALLERDGTREWSIRLPGKIHDLDIARNGDTWIAATGHGECSLSGFSPDGKQAWNTQIERDPTSYWWWEFVTPAAIRVRGGTWNDRACFAVGCGDTRLRFFDNNGEETWRFTGNAAIPARILVDDVDDDGSNEVVFAGDILSACCTCRILDFEGTEKARLWIEGWTSSLTAIACGRHGNMRLMVLGANRGNNLHLYHVQDAEHKFASRHNPTEEDSMLDPHILNTRVGGSVTGIAFEKTSGRFIVATSQGFLMKYSPEGELQWTKLMEIGIDHLVEYADKLFAADEAGLIYLINEDGTQEQVAQPGGRCTTLKTHNNSLICCMDNSLYIMSG